jgi:hypothetical protein
MTRHIEGVISVKEKRWQPAAPWITALTLVVLVNAAFLMLGVWVATLPREPLAQRVREAFASGDLIENDWPWLESRRGFDQYNDCSILQMITNDDDEILANAVGPLIYNKNRGETDKCATLRNIVSDGPEGAPYLVFRYTRYWHGYNPVAAALLSVLDVGSARKALTIVLYGALLLLGVAAGARHRGLATVAAIIAVTGALFWAVPYFGPCFSHAPGDIVLILGLACLLRWRERLSRLATLVPFCAAYGAGVVYLEFLTGQLPTAAGLLFPTAYLIARARPGPDDQPRAAWRFALAALMAFVLGVVLTVVIKQILAVAIVGPEALSSFLEYLGRYVNPSPSASLRHFGETWSSPHGSLVWSSLKAIGAVLGEGYVLTYGSRPAAVVLYAAGALAWLAAGYLAVRRPARWATSDLLAMAAGAGIVVAWTLSFQTHTTLHKFWMVRMLLVPLSMGWGALAWRLITNPARDRATSSWTTAAEVSLG